MYYVSIMHVYLSSELTSNSSCIILRTTQVNPQLIFVALHTFLRSFNGILQRYTLLLGSIINTPYLLLYTTLVHGIRIRQDKGR